MARCRGIPKGVVQTNGFGLQSLFALSALRSEVVSLEVLVGQAVGARLLRQSPHGDDLLGNAQQFLEGLVEWACQPPRVHTHHWTAGDVVLWDNRCLLHRAMPWEMSQPRVMWHSRLRGDEVAELALPSESAAA
ncbi:MAG: hypothetical protein CFE45_28965 [Burkholderiales bacterium PBB5]|nr:MAG: hypothetical protein CFE45_28965 [Burkholderiales bacterium PBB5]